MKNLTQAAMIGAAGAVTFAMFERRGRAGNVNDHYIRDAAIAGALGALAGAYLFPKNMLLGTIIGAGVSEFATEFIKAMK